MTNRNLRRILVWTTLGLIILGLVIVRKQRFSEPPVDGLESSVDGVESSVNGLESSVDGLESYVDVLELPVENLEPSVDGPNLVLVNAYMRTGSTYIGNLLSFRNDTFYWFEPLMVSGGRIYFTNDGLQCDYSSPECRKPSPHGKTVLKNPLGFLMDIYRYRLENYFSEFKRGVTGKQDASYRFCRLKFTAEKCYPIFIRKCATAKYIVTKVLRLDLRLAANLLLTFPRLKILQLMRDPRGTMNCRIHTSWYRIFYLKENYKGLENDVIVLCSRMRNDIEGAKDLIKQFPNRLKVIQYEDTFNISKTLEVINKFLGMDLSGFHGHSEDVVNRGKWLRPDNYRNTLDKVALDIVQKHCTDVIKMLGLRVFKSYEEMAHTNVSIIDHKLTYSLN